MSINTDYGSVWKEYQNGLDYQKTMSFSENWPEYERFKTGDQWPKATPRTRNLPRPVINVIKYIIRNKKSNVLSQAVKMVFQPEEMPGDEMIAQRISQAAQDYTDYTQIFWKDVGQDDLNDRAVEDAATNGLGIFHYYWDNHEHGGTVTQFIGKMKGEILDGINVFFANPQQSDVQKQAWIIISAREDTDRLIATAKENKLPTDGIEADSDTEYEGYDTAQTEMQGERKTTALVKYYKQPVDPKNPFSGSEVWWTKVTQNAVVIPPQRLAPAGSNFTIDLYPVEVFNWESRKKCIYGLGEIEGLIPFQKSLNFGYGMMLLSVQQTAWPKMLAKQGALQETPTNEPGEIIYDCGQPGADNIKYMQPPAFSTVPSQILDNMFSMERTTTGTTEVMTGESVGANMAASAIIALQNQAKVPTQNIQNRLYRSIKRIGRIWEQFYKAYYNQPRSFIQTDPQTGAKTQKLFTGSAYSDVSFGLAVEVGPSSVFSESLMMNTLDKLFDKGKITLQQYAKYAPADVFPAGLRQELENMAAGGLPGMPGAQPATAQNSNPALLAQLGQILRQQGQGGTQSTI